jgi:short-subunit dehydrogenase
LQQGPADQLDVAETERAMRVNFIAATQLTALVAPVIRTLCSRVTACRRPGRCAPFARSR